MYSNIVTFEMCPLVCIRLRGLTENNFDFDFGALDLRVYCCILISDICVIRTNKQIAIFFFINKLIELVALEGGLALPWSWYVNWIRRLFTEISISIGEQAIWCIIIIALIIIWIGILVAFSILMIVILI